MTSFVQDPDSFMTEIIYNVSNQYGDCIINIFNCDNELIALYEEESTFSFDSHSNRIYFELSKKIFNEPNLYKITIDLIASSDGPDFNIQNFIEIEKDEFEFIDDDIVFYEKDCVEVLNDKIYIYI